MLPRLKGFWFPGVALLTAVGIWFLFSTPTPPTEITAQSPVDQTPSPTVTPIVSGPTDTSPTPPPPTLTPAATATRPPAPTPTPTPNPSPTPARPKLYEAVAIEEWPSWCVKPGNDGRPSVPLLPLEAEDFCFNPSSSRVVANVAIEWGVRVDNGSALLLFGQNNTFYRIELQPDEGTITIQAVRDFVRNSEQSLGTIHSAAIHTEADALNTVILARLEPTITLSVNGETVTEFSDILLGDHTPVKVGIGAATDGDDGAIVYLEALNVYVPVK